MADSHTWWRRGPVRVIGAAVAVAVALAAPAAGSAVADGRRPMPVWLPTTTLDLARMTIRATDLPGQGYGTNDGSVYATLDDGTEYTYSIGLADPADPDRMVRRINSTVELFGDVAAAQSDLDQWKADLGAGGEGPEIVIEGSDTAPRQVVPNAPIVGDDSITTTYTGTNTGGGTASVMEIRFRADRIVGSVAVSDFRGSMPSVEEAGAFATEVVRRIRDGIAGNWTGMFHRIVRLNDTDSWIASASETYTMIDGTFIPFLGVPPEAIDAAAAFLTSARVDDAYTYSGTLENEADGRTVGHTAWIYSFADAADATAYLELAAANSLASVAGSTRATPPALTGPAAAISYTGPDGSAGHRIWVQAGSEVVSVDVSRTGGLPIEAVAEFATLQVACAQSATVCPETPVPASLVT